VELVVPETLRDRLPVPVPEREISGGRNEDELVAADEPVAVVDAVPLREPLSVPVADGDTSRLPRYESDNAFTLKIPA